MSLDLREARIAALKNLLKERIVILDGAMGTMIQAQQLDEAAFRGSQFAKHPKDLRQNYDVLNITQPHIVQAINGITRSRRRYPSRPTRSTRMRFRRSITPWRITFTRSTWRARKSHARSPTNLRHPILAVTFS